MAGKLLAWSSDGVVGVVGFVLLGPPGVVSGADGPTAGLNFFLRPVKASAKLWRRVVWKFPPAIVISFRH